MGLKILHSADWHLDSPFAGFDPEQREFLKKAQRRIPGIVAQLCRREACDLVLLAGDLFDGRISRETLDELKRELKRCAVPVLIAPGNHDFCDSSSPWLTEKWPENVYIFTGDLEAVPFPALDCRIYGAAFRSMDCPPLLAGFRAEGTERYQIGLFHGDPTRTDSPYNPVTAAQTRDSGLTYLALGHVHKVGAFRAGKTLCGWPGCPMGRGWDETGEKNICIVTLEGDDAQIQAIRMDLPRFIRMDVNATGGAEAALEKALPGRGNKDFYQISLTGTGDEEITALRERFSAFPNLELLDKREAPMELWEDTGRDTLEGIYFRMLHERMEASATEGDRYRLAAEISRRLLEGREVTL